MAEAKHGDTVKVHYTGKLGDGMIFDTSLEREPLQFTLGENQVIPGFEQAIIGMDTGATKTFTLPADQAYGERREEMVLNVDRKHLPEGLEPEIGQQLQLGQGGDQPLVVVITAVNEEAVTIDGNHPLAGKDLTFEIELIEIG